MDEKDFIEISKKFMDEYPTKFLNPNKEKYYKRFYKYCEKNNLDMNKNTAYEWLLKEAEEDHYDIMITNPNATKKDIEKDKKKMAEEKENIVKRVCKELNITQRQLSEMLEIPESTIARWKSGDLPRLTELFLKTMLENIELKQKLETIKKAHKIISEL
ncbi:helix-turn-helix domain-containing protein [Campylobacter lari]|uniref:helix-turn-helix domain-containing protein n=1 Tax=Campylobacter lari TaxID=201 RepID=UPI0021E689CB|nr:helix-turn-helix domain-containing protein [Campylobacter lari]MCV3522838.1 helix-turn-helix domain-containing protein [Campylobacter lari]